MTLHPLAMVDRQPINIRDTRDLLIRVEAAIDAGRGFSIFTLNLDHLVKRRASLDFRSLYARATFVTADGWPVVRLARRQAPSVQRTAGADLIVPLCDVAARRGVPVALFGSTHEVLAAAAERLCRMVPDLTIALCEAPPYGFDPWGRAAREAIARIEDSGARICLLALGAPKQEMFSDLAIADGTSVGFACIGAGLDFIAGAQVRAPSLVQHLRLEWAWRLVTQPRRLGMRYLRCALLYLRLSFAGKSAAPELVSAPGRLSDSSDPR